MPAAGVRPDEVSFNTMLVLYGHAQDMDGAYRLWPSTHTLLRPVLEVLVAPTAPSNIYETSSLCAGCGRRCRSARSRLPRSRCGCVAGQLLSTE